MIKLAVVSISASKVTIFNLLKSPKISKETEKMEDKLVYACLVKYLEKLYNKELDKETTLRDGFTISYSSCTRSTSRERAITNLAFFAFLVMTGSSELVASDLNIESFLSACRIIFERYTESKKLVQSSIEGG